MTVMIFYCNSIFMYSRANISSNLGRIILNPSSISIVNIFTLYSKQKQTKKLRDFIKNFVF